MRFSIRFADKIVGTLVVLALAILIVVVFMIGRSQRWFKYDYQYYSYFESANGLSKNMAVQYKGFVIGHVKDFNLVDDDRVKVDFTVFEEYQNRVREGSVVEVIASPIGLGNSFIFYPGNGTKVLDEHSIIPDFNSPQGRNYMASGLATKIESGDSISAILNQVSSLLEMINLSLSGGEGSEDLPIGQILANIEDITAGLSDPEGSIMRILDGNNPENLESIINSISRMLDDVSRSTHVLPAQLPVILNNLNSGLMDLQDVLTGISNNPLIRGGIPEKVETGPGGAGMRNLEF